LLVLRQVSGTQGIEMTKIFCLLSAVAAAVLGGGGAALAATAANVEFVVGNVTVTGANGATRRATKGVEIQTGDRIVTNDGRAQLRFTDGAYISLQPNSDFSIREYRYDGRTDGTEKGVFGLLRGALRTVTGAIGRVNRSAYQIQTPTATIGIRGTGGLIQVREPDLATLIAGSSGIWILTPLDGKSIDVPAGLGGIALPKEAGGGAQQTSEKPVLPPEQSVLAAQALPQPPTTPIAGNIVNSDGTPAGLVIPADLTVIESFPGVLIGTSPAKATFDGSGAMTGFTGPSIAKTLTAGSVLDAGNDSVIAWGRWVGSYTEVNTSGTFVQALPGTTSLHYVAAQPATNIPLGSGIAYFSFLGATSPTLASGTAPAGSYSAVTGTNPGGVAAVDFNTGRIGLDFAVTAGGPTYNVTTNGGIANPASSQVSLGSPKFSGGGLTVTGGPCSVSCSGSVEGSLAGNGATHMGFGYNLQLMSDSANGVAVYKR
jgi:hypothetical protein